MAVWLFEEAELESGRHGSWRTPWVTPPGGASRVVFSWCRPLPAGSGLHARARLRLDGEETDWMLVGVRGSAVAGSSPGPFPPGVRLEADELVVEAGAMEAVQLRLDVGDEGPPPAPVGISFWPLTETSAMPEGPPVVPLVTAGRIAQRTLGPELGPHTCGPCSLTMALRHRGEDVDPVTIEARVRDPWTGLRGHWTYLAAEAGERGLRAWVERGGGPVRLMEHLREARLVILSLRWDEGELPGAAVSRSAGHLILAVGGDSRGVDVMDPAFPPGAPELARYDWGSLVRCWRSGAMVVVGKKAALGA